jgi:hypothetical protein
MNILGLVLMTHSLVRWVIEIISAVALIWFLLVWLRGLRNERLDRSLMAAFSGALDVQVLLGIIYILGSGLSGVGFPLYRIEHALLILGVMVLVIIGISRVPGG